MIKKYGVDGVHKKMQEMGRKGKYTTILDENREFIIESVKNKATIQSIADELGIPHKSVRWYIQSRFGGLKNV